MTLDDVSIEIHFLADVLASLAARPVSMRSAGELASIAILLQGHAETVAAQAFAWRDAGEAPAPTWEQRMPDLLDRYPEEQDAIFAAVRAEQRLAQEGGAPSAEEESHLAYLTVLHEHRAAERARRGVDATPTDAEWDEAIRA